MSFELNNRNCRQVRADRTGIETVAVRKMLSIPTGLPMRDKLLLGSCETRETS